MQLVVLLEIYVKLYGYAAVYLLTCSVVIIIWGFEYLTYV